MAYLDLDNSFASPAGARRAQGGAAPVDALPGFSALEWSVIALAKRDTIASLGTPGRLSRALGGVFGRSTTSKLADPRLEALRRMAVHAWRYGFALPMAEIDRFVAAGYSEGQLETMVTSITGTRIGANRRVAARDIGATTRIVRTAQA
ncbi:MAG: hypothetical protein WC804_17745 [Sphingomonas sp.]|jgi:hypothetical protein|uniref:hypothetical protein n=1 Tax=Sphingomonas sp. TaxID=28214 RepID=UPI0035670B06